MAGDWIKVEKSTARKPEVLAIAEALDIAPDHAFGLCLRFWSWCDDHISDGHARSVTKKGLDLSLGVTGVADVLEKVGWLNSRNGSIQVPNFDRHMSQGAKNRALATERQREKRSQKCHGDTVTKVVPEKRREEDIDNTTQRAGVAASADEVARYAASLPMPAPPAAATAFFDSAEANGWVTRQGHAIADWRAAFRRWLSAWNQNEQGRNHSRGNGGPAAPGNIEPMDWEK